MVLYDDFDTQIIKRDERYFLRYGEGGAAEHYVEIEITREDAEHIMQDIMYSVDLIRDYQNKRWGLV